MSELKPCPICEGRFQPFVDNYGKYAAYCTECGMYFGVALECGVELHDGWKAQFKNEKALTDALNRRAQPAQPANKPLTLEELRGMDGEPVWIVAHPDWGHWEMSEDAADYFEDRDEDFYGMTYNDPAGRYGLHALGWLAYRRKPEGNKQ